MVKLRLKVGEKGQILIPKLFRGRYGIKEGEEVAIEPREDGILLRGRPTMEELRALLDKHSSKMKALKVKGSKLGELKDTYQELEFEAN